MENMTQLGSSSHSVRAKASLPQKSGQRKEDQRDFHTLSQKSLEGLCEEGKQDTRQSKVNVPPQQKPPDGQFVEAKGKPE